MRLIKLATESHHDEKANSLTVVVGRVTGARFEVNNILLNLFDFKHVDRTLHASLTSILSTLHLNRWSDNGRETRGLTVLLIRQQSFRFSHQCHLQLVYIPNQKAY